MDDYEVDLIDYLRVMWKGKWIILACLALAVAVSAAIMWTRPNEYAVTVQYQYHQQLSELIARRSVAVATPIGNVSAEQDNALSIAVDAVTLSRSEGKPSKKTATNNGLVRTTLTGSMQPDDLVQVSKDFTSLVEKKLLQQMSDSILLATNSANLQVAQLTKERDMLTERMTAAMATNDPLADYLAEKVADLDATIVRNQALAATLQVTKPSTLYQLSFSQQGPSLVGPNRKMSVAVAGVLGLFVGVLLAFFVHYLISAREREATHKEA